MLQRLILSFACLLLIFSPPLKAEKTGSTTDHSKLKELQGPFSSGPEVTKACLTCHTEAANQVQHSIHGTWEYDHPKTGQKLGKRTVINSFCGNVVSNEPRCTSCHASYGWTDMTKKPPSASNEEKVDCVVCHDTTGEYEKWFTGAGHPIYEPTKKKGKTHLPPDLTKVAQNVGETRRENCGACHYFGGGGDNVKHGDLSTALNAPDKHTDVHMDKDGLNFSCSKCHVSDSHEWAGSHYNLKATDPEGTGKPGERRHSASCESCHGTKPHPNSIMGMKINNHTKKLACETCHIPEFAKGGVATKTYWDWSSAGKDDFHVEDYKQGNGKHRHGYLKTKGIFKYGEDVKPYYAWFNGEIEYKNTDRKIDPNNVVEVNSLNGEANAEDSRIWPFKRMQGRQAYDKVNNNLVYTQVWGPKTNTAYWTNFDWQKSITTAMKKADKPYSGEYGFVDTYMYWPITHMVSPKEEALDCKECHAKDGRLSDLEGLYMPATSGGMMKWIDLIGLLAILGTLIGVLGHAGVRWIMAKRRAG